MPFKSNKEKLQEAAMKKRGRGKANVKIPEMDLDLAPLGDIQRVTSKARAKSKSKTKPKKSMGEVLSNSKSRVKSLETTIHKAITRELKKIQKKGEEIDLF